MDLGVLSSNPQVDAPSAASDSVHRTPKLSMRDVRMCCSSCTSNKICAHQHRGVCT